MLACARMLVPICLAVAVLADAPTVAAQALHERFAEMRPALTRQLKSSRTRERISAIHSLQRFPVAESARLVHGCFGDEHEDVRRAAYEALHDMNHVQDVCDELIRIAEAGLEDSDAEVLLPALAPLLASELPLAHCQVQIFLDRELIKLPAAPEMLVALADNLGAHGKEMDIRPLERMATCRLFTENFGIRRAVAQALAKTPPDETLDVLIGLLDKLGGEAKADAAAHLSRVTGQRFGMNTVAWQKWRIEATGLADQIPAAATTTRLTAKLDRADEVASENGHYYGMPIYANRLLFVLDVSGSMQGGRFAAAKRELLQAIQNLKPHARFGIVVFNTEVTRWQHELVAADDRQKKLAERFIENLNPRASTATFDALATALDYEVEAVYFLTDGAPTCGQVVAPVDIVRTVSGNNRMRRISIYTIGIAPGTPGSHTDVFLKTLADENLGTYRRVDG